MPSLRVLLATAIAALLVLTPVAAVEPEPPEEVLEPVTAWFVCDGDTPEATVNYRLGNATPTWGYSEPTGSWLQGEGCGSGNDSFINGTEQESPYNLSFAGEFEGKLDTFTVRLHNAYLGTYRRENPEQPIIVRVTIDDLSVFGVEDRTGTDVDGGTFETVTHSQPAERHMMIQPIAEGPTDPAPIFEFSVTGIDYLTEEDAELTHRVVVTVQTPFSGGNRQNLWLWGAEEFASSITFNDDAEPDCNGATHLCNEAIPRDEREEHDHE